METTTVHTSADERSDSRLWQVNACDHKGVYVSCYNQFGSYWNAEKLSEVNPCLIVDNVFNICSNDLPENVEVSQVVETLVNSPGFGTRCMNGNPIPWVLEVNGTASTVVTSANTRDILRLQAIKPVVNRNSSIL